MTVATISPLRPGQVVASTTSHKREAIGPTLEVFARLGFFDLDVNLNHVIERGVPIEQLRRAMDRGGQRALIVSGGWCDFFDPPSRIDATFASVDRQVIYTRILGANALRLFFGRLPHERYDESARSTAAANIRRLTERHPGVLFVFENHDGASSSPRVCGEILREVDRPNARLNFDPINFEHRGVTSGAALNALQPLVTHVHLKGYNRGQFCEFGAGQVDLVPVIRQLLATGYRGGFTVEYEGTFDRTVRLYQGVKAAEAVIAQIQDTKAVDAAILNPYS